jgi:segregation and condensation protein A
LGTAEAEVTIIATEADARAEEHVEVVKALDVPAEEPVAAEHRSDTEVAPNEEPEEKDLKENAMTELVPEENTEPQEDTVDKPMLSEFQPVEAGSEELVETQAAELHEGLNDEPVLPEPEVVAEAASEEIVESPVPERAEGTDEEPEHGEARVTEEQVSETVASTQVAEVAEAAAVEEVSAEARRAQEEGEEPSSDKGASEAVALDVEEEPQPRVPELVALIGGAAAGAEAGETAFATATETPIEAGPEAAPAPAQLELIPKPRIDEKTAAKLAEQQRRRKEAEAESPFSVMVGQVYDGPLDLLLDLIRKQDIDVYDIPIAKITAQFLAYVNQLKASDVDVAGEFIYTASLLIHIKSKMLLPRTAEAPGEAAEDPRRELVERLLEHERFKNAAQMLQQKQMMEAASWSNPGYREFVDDEGAEPEIAADTVDLVKVFREILERARNRPVLDVAEDTVTVGQMIRFLGRRLMMEDKPIALRKLLSHTRSERALIAMFLALLELVRLQAVLLRQDKAFSEIFIKKHAAFETVMNEGLANARDDWR